MNEKKKDSEKPKSVYVSRLDKVREALGIKTAKMFCTEAGVNKDLLSSGQKELTTKHLVPILLKFPQVNPYYILLGVGKPLIEGFGSGDSIAASYIINELQNVQMEVRTLIAENATLKCKIASLEKENTENPTQSTEPERKKKAKNGTKSENNIK